MNYSFKGFIASTLLFITCLAYAQQPDDIMVSKAGDTIKIVAIPTIQINAKLEQVNTDLKKFNEILKPVPEVHAIDSLAKSASAFLADQKKEIYDSKTELSIREIDDFNREWMGYDKELEKWQTTLSKRISDIDKQAFSLTVIINTWLATKKAAIDEKLPTELIARISEEISASKKVEKDLKKKQDELIVLQNKLTDFQIAIDGVIDFLAVKRKDLQSNYFIRDSYYLWNASDSTLSLDSLRHHAAHSLGQNVRSFELFLETNKEKTYTHLFFSILIFISIYLLHIEFNKQEYNSEDNRMMSAKKFLSHYLASSFLLSFLISLFIYSNIPATINELIQLLILIPSIFLIKKSFSKKLNPIIYTLLLLFIIDEFQVLFDSKSLVVRLTFILENIILFWILFQIISKKSPIREMASPKWLRFIIRLANVLIVVTSISLLGNILGFVNLSLILTNTTISIILSAVILFLTVKVLDGVLISLIKSPIFQFSNIVKKYANIIIDKSFTSLIYIAFFFWIRSTLKALGLKEQFGNWLTGLMDVEWEVGSGNISLGGIIGFVLAIFLTVVITNVVKYILEDEIFPRVTLPRGVPGAISMLVRYVIVAYGIYIALAAAGIELSKFGIIAGALGVGIGFGLQGIVYNFIAGLILAFERPIQKGDTIEIGTLMGDVLNIGVRASTIRTFDGSDVFVPNGNLISNELINWTLTDRKKRREVKVGVAYGTDPREVMELLKKVAGSHPDVLPNPKPWPLFVGFGDSSLNFRVLFWAGFDSGMTVASEVAMMIYDALIEKGIQIPFPQTDLHVKSFDPTVQKTIIPFIRDEKKEISKSDKKNIAGDSEL